MLSVLALAAGLLTLMTAPANAVPDQCASGARTITPQSGEASGSYVIVRDSSGVIAGRILVRHSDYCRTGWAIWYPNDARFHGELSMWNSRNQNQKAWTGTGGAVSQTEMIDDAPGVTSCVGMQVYYNGEWRRWQMGFCW
jgi:hypothetical protein